MTFVAGMPDHLPPPRREIAKFRCKETGLPCGGVLAQIDPTGRVINQLVVLCKVSEQDRREVMTRTDGFVQYGSGPVPIVPKGVR